MRREVLTGVVLFDEEEGSVLRLPNTPDDMGDEVLLHCGAIVPGELVGKTVRVTIEEVLDDTPPS